MPGRIKTPTVLQMEALECGAAALSMVLGYFGRFVPLEQLRMDCGISRDGSKASNILRAARLYGLDAKGYKKELAELDDTELPAIIFWEFNHFVVLEGMRKNLYYINDPAIGHRVLSAEEFEKAFTGVVLEFETRPDFAKGGARPNILRSAFEQMAKVPTSLLFLTLTALAIVLTLAVFPGFFRLYIDDILVRGLDRLLLPLMYAILLSAFLRSAMMALRNRFTAQLGAKITLSTSSEFLWHILRLPVEFFGQRYVGDISNRVQSNAVLAKMKSTQVADIILSLVVFVIYIGVMTMYDAVLTLVCVLAMCFTVLVAQALRGLQSGVNQRLVSERSRLLSAVVSGLYTIESIKANGSESDFFTRFSGLRARLANVRLRGLVPTAISSSSAQYANWLCIVVVLSIGSLRVMQGDMSAGMLIAFEVLAISLLAPFQALGTVVDTVELLNFEQTRIDDVMRCGLDAEWSKGQASADDGASLTHLTGRVSVSGLSFAYDRYAKNIIEDFSLELKPASRVAIVGATGSGKSTVAKLICGLYQPLSGDVCFDGVSRRQIPREVIAAHIGYVEQDLYLMAGTIWNNLTLWDDSVPQADVIQAAKDAQIHDQIVNVLNGYDDYVDEGGRNLSGGEIQRLEIARALVRNPTILVLDECMSALDPLTEKQIDDSLRRRGCTCIIVAHRLSTIRDCDEIIVLDAGRIVQRGTHETLIKEDGVYRKLIEATV